MALSLIFCASSERDRVSNRLGRYFGRHRLGCACVHIERIKEKSNIWSVGELRTQGYVGADVKVFRGIGIYGIEVSQRTRENGTRMCYSQCFLPMFKLYIFVTEQRRKRHRSLSKINRES